jgi:general stress protein 26
MKVDDPAVLDVLQRSMTARIASLSRNGRPSINPLYFVYVPGSIWLGTVEWTLAARNVQTDPRVSVLFEVEQDHESHRVLRINGRARVRTDSQVQRSYNRRVTRKYVLTLSGIRHYLAHLRQLPFMRRYHAQSASRGHSCVIEVTPLEAEFLGAEKLG